MSWWRPQSNRERKAGPEGGRTKARTVRLVVNGEDRQLEVTRRTTLLSVLQDRLGLTGSLWECGSGDCGSCTVLVDDAPRKSCQTLAVEIDGRAVTTVEGLSTEGTPGPVQQAFAEREVFFCGSCLPGQMMVAEGLLRADPDPSPKAIQEAMAQVECRCGAHHLLFSAVRRAAELWRQHDVG